MKQGSIPKFHTVKKLTGYLLGSFTIEVTGPSATDYNIHLLLALFICYCIYSSVTGFTHLLLYLLICYCIYSSVTGFINLLLTLLSKGIFVPQIYIFRLHIPYL